MPRSGESLGKYKLIRRIGLGGMAEVWLARSTGPAGFAKNLVVKTVLEHQAQNTEFIAQFLDEARLAALLTHPNIVQIFDLGDSDGIYFIAMEYIRGQDLQDVRKQCSDASKPLPLALLSRIACGVCEGLHYAHDLKSDDGKPLDLVHREISPENVLISYDGVVKIVDFGIAKASISQVTTRAGLFKGKLHYATPERLLGQPIDRRDDVYGLGAVLYETATGQPPISGRSEGEMVKKILDGEFDKPSVLVPDMDPEFERIILKCMAWAPDISVRTRSRPSGRRRSGTWPGAAPVTRFPPAVTRSAPMESISCSTLEPSKRRLSTAPPSRPQAWPRPTRSWPRRLPLPSPPRQKRRSTKTTSPPSRRAIAWGWWPASSWPSWS